MSFFLRSLQSRKSRGLSRVRHTSAQCAGLRTCLVTIQMVSMTFTLFDAGVAAAFVKKLPFKASLQTLQQQPTKLIPNPRKILPRLQADMNDLPSYHEWNQNQPKKELDIQRPQATNTSTSPVTAGGSPAAPLVSSVPLPGGHGQARSSTNKGTRLSSFPSPGTARIATSSDWKYPLQSQRNRKMGTTASGTSFQQHVTPSPQSTRRRIEIPLLGGRGRFFGFWHQLMARSDEPKLDATDVATSSSSAKYNVNMDFKGNRDKRVVEDYAPLPLISQPDWKMDRAISDCWGLAGPLTASDMNRLTTRFNPSFHMQAHCLGVGSSAEGVTFVDAAGPSLPLSSGSTSRAGQPGSTLQNEVAHVSRLPQRVSKTEQCVENSAISSMKGARRGSSSLAAPQELPVRDDAFPATLADGVMRVQTAATETKDACSGSAAYHDGLDQKAALKQLVLLDECTAMGMLREHYSFADDSAAQEELIAATTPERIEESNVE
ncbi:unnamed protein product [Amoebophrya sp. A25]|nr:unnamed protein product [Amoebophrya sp. A25]|eukprot:GSA25T00005786001.1